MAYQVQEYYPECPEALIVGLARSGDKDAFAELVRRYQSSIRQLMRRCSGDVSLADDLAQQTFLQAWLKIRALRAASAFGGWLRKLAISIWLQSVRKKDALRGADNDEDSASNALESIQDSDTGIAHDLDSALAQLGEQQRLCIVLSYHEGMSHSEVAEATGLPLGTVKSHISRGSQQLRRLLSAYVKGS